MEKLLNILAVTLARGGSKGIKNKNIIQIRNKPLIYYTIKEAKKSNLFPIISFLQTLEKLNRFVKNIELTFLF